MNGKTHRLVGIATVGAIGLIYPTLALGTVTLTPMVGLLMADVGSKIADVDIERSEYGNKFPLLAKIFKHRGFTHTGLIVLLQLIAFYFVYKTHITPKQAMVEFVILFFVFQGSLVCSIGLKLIKKLFKRNKLINVLLHLIPLALTIVIYALIKDDLTRIHNVFCSVMFGFIVAYISHILADMCNRKGIPLFYPFTKKHFHIAKVKTGTWEEIVFGIIYILFIVVTVFGIKCYF